MRKFIYFLILFIVKPNIVFAGSWSSGGGELVADVQNPWFIQNTNEVTYCIKVHDNFGQDLSNVRSYVYKSFQYWRKQFSKALTIYSNGAPMPIKIATQTFSELTCDDDVDIMFQFGFLTKEQQEWISDPWKFIALTVRTEYDRKNLKGKGFVYVAPQDGSLAIDDRRLVDKPWAVEDGLLLYPVLVHELGHIFGLQHDSGIAGMGVRDIEGFLEKDGIDFKLAFLKLFTSGQLKAPNVFVFQNFDVLPQSVCYPIIPERLRKFYGIDQPYKCLEEKVENEKLIISAGYDHDKLLIIGTAELEREDSISDQHDAVKIWMPEEQEVFPNAQFSHPLLTAAIAQGFSRLKGPYHSKNGTFIRQVFLKVTPNGNKEVGGISNGTPVFDIHSGF